MSVEQVGGIPQAAVPQIENMVARQSGDKPAVTDSARVGNAQAEGASKASAAETAKELSDAVKTTNKFMQALSQNLQFSIDKDTDKTVIKLVDSGTKEVIRQIPSEEMLAIAKALDKLQGLLIRDKA